MIYPLCFVACYKISTADINIDRFDKVKRYRSFESKSGKKKIVIRVENTTAIDALGHTGVTSEGLLVIPSNDVNKDIAINAFADLFTAIMTGEKTFDMTSYSQGK